MKPENIFNLKYQTFVMLVLVFFIISNPFLAAEEKPIVSTDVPKAHLVTFFQNHCIKCHGPDKEEGNVRFDKISYEISNNATATQWQEVLDVLNGGEMPPEEEPQPKRKDLAKALEKLTDTLVLAKRRLTEHGGEITMRRLNRREYANTIQHLFGYKILLDSIPEDEASDTFDTVGSQQFFSSYHFNQYLELAKMITTESIRWGKTSRRNVHTTRKEAEERLTKVLRERLADLDAKMAMKKQGKTWQEMGFKDKGEMEIIFRQFDSRAGKPRRYLQYPLVEQGVYLTDISKRVGANNMIDPRARYTVRLRAGLLGTPPAIRRFLVARNNDGEVGYVPVKGTTEKPEIVEMSYTPRLGPGAGGLGFEENRNPNIRTLDGYINKIDKGGQWASIWIDYIETEGPFFRDYSLFEKLMKLDHDKTKNLTKHTEQDAREFFEAFAFEAFRHRPAEPEYIDQLVDLFKANQAAGQNYESAIVEPIAIILSSPSFLYIHEPTRESKKLDDRNFAIRLAYFLWSSPPDEELYRHAKDKTLSDPKVLKSQIDRMLDDPKANAFYKGFVSQWAELDRFLEISVDPNLFPHFNNGIRDSAYQETVEFFKELIKQDLPVEQVVDSDFVTINPVLAAHYEIEGVDSPGFTKIKLPSDSNRGGLLGQVSFLTAGSTGERSSPVIRGALVMEKLLHDKPSPPPPNVPELDQASKEPLAIRDIVALHQSKPQCASCHAKMDQIGFGLENFDAIGRWRDTEKVGRKPVPINPSGKIPGGGEFTNVQELKQVLLENKNLLARELTESFLAYGLGRTIEFSDTESVEQILTQLEKKDYRMRTMIHEIVASPLFRRK